MCVRQIVDFIRDASVTHFVCRSDREKSVGAMTDETVSMIGRVAGQVFSDTDATDHGLPIASADDDEPDAPSEMERASAKPTPDSGHSSGPAAQRE